MIVGQCLERHCVDGPTSSSHQTPRRENEMILPQTVEMARPSRHRPDFAADWHWGAGRAGRTPLHRTGTRPPRIVAPHVAWFKRGAGQSHEAALRLPAVRVDVGF